MRFESIPLGETRQLDGPWFGVRVLDADAGAGSALVVDRLALPLQVLPALKRDIDRIIATGPITFVVADEPGEALSDASASPLPPGVGIYREVVLDTYGANFNFSGRSYDLIRPGWARRLHVNMITGGVTAYTGTPAYNLDAILPGGLSKRLCAGQAMSAPPITLMDEVFSIGSPLMKNSAVSNNLAMPVSSFCDPGPCWDRLKLTWTGGWTPGWGASLVARWGA